MNGIKTPVIVRDNSSLSGHKDIVQVITLRDITWDDSQRRFLAQHSVAALLRHCFECLQHRASVATLRCAKNRRYESSRVTSP